jgi:hypothetical protein
MKRTLLQQQDVWAAIVVNLNYDMDTSTSFLNRELPFPIYTEYSWNKIGHISDSGKGFSRICL